MCNWAINLLFNIFFCWYVYCVLTPGFLGGSTVETCQPCPPGHYCNQRGGTEPSGHCVEGYYCPEGQTSQRPQLHVCSLGHYCEKVSHVPLVLKLLSVITAEFCMRFPHSRVLWYDKDITLCCSQLMLSPRLDQSVSVFTLCCVCLHSYHCSAVITVDSCCSPGVKSCKIILIVISGQCETDPLYSWQLPAQTGPRDL